jgi:hypothetical protein
MGSAATGFGTKVALAFHGELVWHRGISIKKGDASPDDIEKAMNGAAPQLEEVKGETASGVFIRKSARRAKGGGP